MRIDSFCLAVLLVVGLSGCAGTPRTDALGRPVVWIRQINRDTAQGAASQYGSLAGSISSQLGGSLTQGVLATLLGRGVGRAVAESKPGRIHVSFYYSNPEDGFTIGPGSQWRDVWPGAELLQASTWAVLSRDEKGRIFLACDPPCPPVSEVAALADGTADRGVEVAGPVLPASPPAPGTEASP